MGRPCPNPSILTREFLYQAYVVEKRNILAIAREVHVRNGTVINLLREYGFAEQYVTREWMIEHYVTLQETVDDIAEQLHCTEENVRAYLRKFAISIRYKSRGRVQIPQLNDREWLYNHYVIQGYSCLQIAEELNCNESSVNRAFVRFGITLRAPLTKAPSGTRVSRRAFTAHKRRLIHRRDGWACQWPGCGDTSEIEAHHIVPVRDGGTNHLDNGITLCVHCHRKTLGRELEFAPLFQSIIAAKKKVRSRSSSLYACQMRLFF